MVLRLQKLDDSGWGWARVRVALRPGPGEPWSVRTVRQHRLGAFERQAGINDATEAAELHQQAQAARREWGHEGGFAEWRPGPGVRRHPGDLRRQLAD